MEPVAPILASGVRGKPIRRGARDFQRLSGPPIEASELPPIPPPADIAGGGKALGGYIAVMPRCPSLMLISRCFVDKLSADAIAWLVTGARPDAVRRTLEVTGYVLSSAVPVSSKPQVKAPATDGGVYAQPQWPPVGVRWTDPHNTELSEFKPRVSVEEAGPLALFVAYGRAGGLIGKDAAATLGQIGSSGDLLSAASHSMRYYHPRVSDKVISVTGTVLDWAPLQTHVGPEDKQVSMRTATGCRAELCGPFLCVGELTSDLVLIPVDLGYPALPALRSVGCAAALAESPAGPWAIDRLLNKVYNDLGEYHARERPGCEPDVDTCLQDRVPDYMPRVACAQVRVRLSKLRAAVTLVSLRPCPATTFAQFATAVDKMLVAIDEFHTRKWYAEGISIGGAEFRSILESLKRGAGPAATAKAHKEAEELASEVRAHEPAAVARATRMLEAPRRVRFKAIDAERRSRAIELGLAVHEGTEREEAQMLRTGAKWSSVVAPSATPAPAATVTPSVHGVDQATIDAFAAAAAAAFRRAPDAPAAFAPPASDEPAAAVLPTPTVTHAATEADAQALLQTAARMKSPGERDADTLIAYINQAMTTAGSMLGTMGQYLKSVFGAFIGHARSFRLAVRDALAVWSAQPTFQEGMWYYRFTNCFVCVPGTEAGPYAPGAVARVTSHAEVLDGIWGPVRVEVYPNLDELDQLRHRGVVRIKPGPVPAGLTGEYSSGESAAFGSAKDIVLLGSVIGAIGKIMSVLKACYIFIARQLGLPAPRRAKVIGDELHDITSELSKYCMASKVFDHQAESLYQRLLEVYDEAQVAELGNEARTKVAAAMLLRIQGPRSHYLDEVAVRKQEPVVLFISGRPGAGKDVAASHIATALANHFRDPSGAPGAIYINQDSSPFIDNWNNAVVMVMQDLLASSDPTTRTASCERFLNINSGAIARTQAAVAEDKGKIMLHKFFIATTNESTDRDAVPLTMRCPDAFWRRVSLHVTMVPGRPANDPHFVIVHLGPSCGLPTIKNGTTAITGPQLIALMLRIEKHKAASMSRIAEQAIEPSSDIPDFLYGATRVGPAAGAGAGAPAHAASPPTAFGTVAVGASTSALAAPTSAASVPAPPPPSSTVAPPSEGAQSAVGLGLAVGAGLILGAFLLAYMTGRIDTPVAYAERTIKRAAEGLSRDAIGGVAAYLSAVFRYVYDFGATLASRVFGFLWQHVGIALPVGALALIVLAIRAWWSTGELPQAAVATTMYDSSKKRRQQLKVLPYAFSFTRVETQRAQASRSAVAGVLQKVTNNTVEITVTIDGCEPTSVCGTFLTTGRLLTVAHAFVGPAGASDTATGIALGGSFSFIHNHKRYAYKFADVDMWRSRGASNDVLVVHMGGGPPVAELRSHLLPAVEHGGTFQGTLVGNPTDLILGECTIGDATEYAVTAGKTEHAFRTPVVYQYKGGVTKEGYCGRIVADSRTGHIVAMHISGSAVRGCAVPIPADAFGEFEQARHNPICPGGDVVPLSTFVEGHHDSYGGPSGFVRMPGADVLDIVAAGLGLSLKRPSKEQHPRGSVGITDIFPYDPPPESVLSGVHADVFDVVSGLVFAPGYHAPISTRDALPLVDPTTSPGLPYTAMGYQHKGELLDGEELEHFVQDVDDLSRQVSVPGFGPLVSIKLKDELLSQGKMIRAISAMGIDWHVLILSGYWSLEQATMACRDGLRVAKGINPVSPDWAGLRARFDRFHTVACYDARKLDQSISADFIEEFARCAHARLGPAAPLYLRDAVRCLAHGWWVYDGTAFRSNGMNPSGNYLTVTINDFVMNTVFLLCLSKATGLSCAEVVGRFDWVTYGDDSLVGLDEGVDQVAFMEAAALYGIKLTHADKKDHAPDYSTPREEITFLKRYLYHQNEGVWVPRIEVKSILSSASYRRREDRTGAFYSQRVQSALREASMWGPELHSQVRGSAIKSLSAYSWQYTPTGRPEPVPTYDQDWSYMRAAVLGLAGAETYMPDL